MTIGRRLGAYQLLEEIGSGGMGEVYRAVRADDEYQDQVAIKLVRGGQGSAFVVERLRAERQILASFKHPNIARLLDGGTDEDGVPYLVMELIEGQPITTYCNQQQLGITERLRLFLLVCSAVQYAHERMVIHRDLKPSNILVTTEGTPKLLDFGIAKILEPSLIPLRTDATIAAQRIVTPEYASPEQLRGDAVTAASDVYSLAVILYELLTGARPYPTSGMLMHQALELLLEREPPRPSTVVRQRPRSENNRPEPGEVPRRGASAGPPERLTRRLRGDLDNIVLMALRREPERRYPTVAQFAQDIERHLQHLPVTARRPTLGYLLGSFVTRHTVGVAISGALAAVLAAAVMVTAREAHIAETQRALAAQHFASVRRLADTFLFQVHDTIRDLPGAGPARDLLVSTALSYLDTLAAQAGSDLALKKELAEGYLRLGDIQGAPGEQNRGQAGQAVASYAKALVLLAQISAAAGEDESVLTASASAHLKRSYLMMFFSGDPRAATRESGEAVAALAKLAARRPDDVHAALNLVEARLTQLYEAGYAGDDQAVAESHDQAVAEMEAWHRRLPGDRLVTLALARAYAQVSPPHAWPASALIERRLSEVQRALLLSERVLDAEPAHQVADWRSLTQDWNALGIWLSLEQQHSAAVGAFHATVAAIQIVAQDSHDIQAQIDLTRARLNLERAQLATGQLDELEQELPQTLASIESIQKIHDTVEIRFFLAECQQQLGRFAELRALSTIAPSEQLRRLREAHEWYARSAPTLEGIARAASLDVWDHGPVDDAEAGLARSTERLPSLELISGQRE